MNRKTIILLIQIALIVTLFAQKLTKKENELRKQKCGEGMRLKDGYGRKVLNGVRTKIENAPWNIAIEVNNEETGLCTGTLISTRHVITARHCFAQLTDHGYTWSTSDELIQECHDDETDIVLKRNFSEMFKVYAGTDCGYRKYCSKEKLTSIGISKIILPKVCDDKQLDFDDFAILELSESLKFSKSVQPVCVASDDINLFEEEVKMKLFGFGVNPSDGKMSAGKLRSETVKPEQCFTTTKKSFCTSSISKNQLACMGDSGGGVVRMADNRVTVVGVIYQGVTCETTTVNEKDYVANVAYYSDDICKYTGICSRNIALKVGTGKPSNCQFTIRMPISTCLLLLYFSK